MYLQYKTNEICFTVYDHVRRSKYEILYVVRAYLVLRVAPTIAWQLQKIRKWIVTKIIVINPVHFLFPVYILDYST